MDHTVSRIQLCASIKISLVFSCLQNTLSSCIIQNINFTELFYLSHCDFNKIERKTKQKHAAAKSLQDWHLGESCCLCSCKWGKGYRLSHAPDGQQCVDSCLRIRCEYNGNMLLFNVFSMLLLRPDCNKISYLQSAYQARSLLQVFSSLAACISQHSQTGRHPGCISAFSLFLVLSVLQLVT